MSLATDLSRSAAQTSRAVRQGANTAAREIRRGVASFGRASLGVIRAVLRSYNRGVFLTYTQTGGNLAVKLSEIPPTTHDFHQIELLAHRTISFAWFFGLLGSILANSYRTSIDTTIYILNKSLHEDNQLSTEAAVNRHWFSTMVLGSVGLAVGLMVGTAGFLVVGTGRVFTNSWISLTRLSAQVTNLALADSDKFKPGNDKRSWPLFIIGLPGAVVGIGIGAFGFLGAGALRSVVNSWISLVGVTAQGTNLALDNKFDVGSDRRSWTSFVLGLPGAALGVFFGAVGFLAVGAARSLNSSWTSLTRVSAQGTNLALPENNKFILETDYRSWPLFLIGLPGAGIGLFTGAVGFLAVGAARSLNSSWTSLTRVSAQGTNLALPESNKFILETDYRSWPLFLIGLPGAGIGLFTGAVGFLAVGAARSLNSSWTSLTRVSAQGTNLALPESNKFILETDYRSWPLFLIGLPGAGIGLFTGAVGFLAVGTARSLNSSWTSLTRVSAQGTNLALPESNKFILETDYRSWPLFLIGLPGAGIGLFTGAVGFLAVGAARSLNSSWTSLTRVSAQGTNLALPESNKFILETDSRSWPLFLIGLPGAGIGLFTGAVGFLAVGTARSLNSSWTSLTRVSAQGTNLALPESNKFILETDYRSWPLFLIGLPGAGIGLFTGAVGFLAVGAARSLNSSWTSLTRVSAQGTNLALPESNKFILETDYRSWPLFLIGLPGAGIGLFTGAVGFLAVGAARSLNSSWTSLTRVSAQGTNLALPESNKFILETDSRSWPLFLIGLPGAGIGLFTGAVGFLAVGAARSLNSSWTSLTRVSAQGTNLALPESNKFILETDSRSWPLFLIGLPGAGIGLFTGAVGFLAVGAARSLNSSWTSLTRVSAQGTNLALPESNKFILETDSRSWPLFLIGLPGAGIGLFTGAVGFLAVGAARSLNSSWTSLTRVSAQGTNLALPESNKFILETDYRSWPLFLIGLPGAGIGLFTGAVGFLAVGAARSLNSSWTSLTRVSAQGTNLALPESNKFILETDYRSWPLFLIGLPGAAFGVGIGAFGFVGAGALRSVVNSWISLARVTAQGTNLALDNKFDVGSDRRSWTSFVLGFPGAALGVLVGAAGFVGVGVARTMFNSAKSYKDLSGSIMNVALERAIFDGYKNDSTLIKRWGFGFPGAALSILTAGAAGLTLLAVRKLVPVLFGVVTSPFIGLWRTCSELYKYRNNDLRFNHTENATEQAFKDLFASLTAMGGFPEGEKPTRAANGPFYTQGYLKNALKFVRKALTFNQQTTTEKLLSLALTEYRTARTQAQSSAGRDCELAVTAVENSATRLIADCDADSHWVTPDSEKTEMREEIQRVRDFIKTFINARVAPMDDPEAPLGGTALTLLTSSRVAPSSVEAGSAVEEAQDPTAPGAEVIIPQRLYPTDIGRMSNLFFNGRFPPSAPPAERMPEPSAPPTQDFQANHSM